jgi:hypothetical protein
MPSLLVCIDQSARITDEAEESMIKTRFLLLSFVVLFSACSKDPNVKELEQAARAVEQMVGPFYANRSSFFVVFPNGTPRQYVSWFFSSMGASDWPPVDRPSELAQDELDALRQIGMVFRPVDVYYRHSKPDTSVRKQIVLKWDDAEGLVILEGYLDPSQEPVLTRSFKIPKDVVPDAIAKAVTEMNLENGMTYQAF